MLHSAIAVVSTLSVLFVFCASAYVTAFALRGLRQRSPAEHADPGTRFLVLVPAHNESRGMLPTLRSLQHTNYPAALLRIAVIADNCSDDTAEVARECGCETWIRTDSRNPGKGQALSWALDKAACTFDLAAIIDADTEVDEDFFAAMNSAYIGQRHKPHGGVVFQGKYLFSGGRRATSWLQRFTIASKAAENAFTYRPRTILGLSNLIQGNGFCISQSVLEQVPFAAVSVVEDAEYAMALALKGIEVVYVEDAVVTSRITEGLRATAPQRLRWAGGVFALLARSAPRLLGAAFWQRRWRLAEMALMLILTSRMLLIYATGLAVILLDLAFPFHSFTLVTGILATAILFQAVYLYMVLRHAGDAPVPFRTIAFIPFYMCFLGAVQIGAVFGFRRRLWSRTIR